MKKHSFSLHTLSLALLLCLASTSQAFFNPTVGKWANRDPIGERGGKNLFAFVGSEPLSRIDKLGLSAVTALPHSPSPIGPDEKMQEFMDWHRQQMADLSWLRGLAACPCRLVCLKPFFTWNPVNPNTTTWNDPSSLTFGYHPGAKWCMRSKTQPPAPGQQCCYDDNGQLITHGAGAGTPDRISPGTLGTGGHGAADVDPYDLALQLDGGTPGRWVALYLQARPPNNANGCAKNP